MTSHSSPSIPLRPFLALLAGGIAIGFGGIFMRFSDVNPIASAFWRMALASPLLWLSVFYSNKNKASSKTQTTPQKAPLEIIILWTGFYFAGDLALWHSSLHYTTIANATLLSNLAPIFIALFLWKMYRVHFPPLFLMGLSTALLGAGLLVLGQETRHSPLLADANPLLGNSLGAISALFYAAYQLAIKKARHHYPALPLMAWSTSITAVFLLIPALLTPGHFFPQHINGWIPLLGLALVSQLGGQTIITYASAHLPASLSSVSLLIQPLTAACAAWLIFQEKMSLLQLGGGVLLLLGIYYARNAPQHKNAN